MNRGRVFSGQAKEGRHLDADDVLRFFYAVGEKPVSPGRITVLQWQGNDGEFRFGGSLSDLGTIAHRESRSGIDDHVSFDENELHSA